MSTCLHWALCMLAGLYALGAGLIAGLAGTRRLPAGLSAVACVFIAAIIVVLVLAAGDLR